MRVLFFCLFLAAAFSVLGAESKDNLRRAAEKEGKSHAQARGMGHVRNIEDLDRIPGQYLVGYHSHEGKRRHKRDLPDFHVLHDYETIPVMAIRDVSDETVISLSERPEVKYVEADVNIKVEPFINPIFELQNITNLHQVRSQNDPIWNLDRLNQRTPPLDQDATICTPQSSSSYPAYQGAGIDAYIVDTGILLSHDQFDGRAEEFYDAFSGGSDCNGHGTHVAGTVGGLTVGVAPGVTLKSVRVLDCQGSGSYSGVIAGLNAVNIQVKRKPKVAVGTLSLGGPRSQALNDAVALGRSHGILYAVASGNSNVDARDASPASEPSVITVGSTSPPVDCGSDVDLCHFDQRSSFSNFGTMVDVHAPGSNILSSYIGGNNYYAYTSGTSMACPHVAGALALYAEKATNDLAGEFPTEETLIEIQKQFLSHSTHGNLISAPSPTPNNLLYLEERKCYFDLCGDGCCAGDELNEYCPSDCNERPDDTIIVVGTSCSVVVPGLYFDICVHGGTKKIDIVGGDLLDYSNGGHTITLRCEVLGDPSAPCDQVNFPETVRLTEENKPVRVTVTGNPPLNNHFFKMVAESEGAVHSNHAQFAVHDNTVTKPELQYPELNQVVSLPLTFEWGLVATAIHYEIEIRYGGTTEVFENILEEKFTWHGDFQAPSRTYQWRVAAVGPCRKRWSSSRTFETTAPTYSCFHCGQQFSLTSQVADCPHFHHRKLDQLVVYMNGRVDSVDIKLTVLSSENEEKEFSLLNSQPGCSATFDSHSMVMFDNDAREFTCPSQSPIAGGIKPFTPLQQEPTGASQYWGMFRVRAFPTGTSSGELTSFCVLGERDLQCMDYTHGHHPPGTGDGVCQPVLGENCVSHPDECAGVTTGWWGRYCCGSGCEGMNCHRCSRSGCTAQPYACNDALLCCGDGECHAGENGCNCAADCPEQACAEGDRAIYQNIYSNSTR